MLFSIVRAPSLLLTIFLFNQPTQKIIQHKNTTNSSHFIQQNIFFLDEHQTSQKRTPTTNFPQSRKPQISNLHNYSTNRHKKLSNTKTPTNSSRFIQQNHFFFDKHQTSQKRTPKTHEAKTHPHSLQPMHVCHNPTIQLPQKNLQCKTLSASSSFVKITHFSFNEKKKMSNVHQKHMQQRPATLATHARLPTIRTTNFPKKFSDTKP